MGIIENLKNKKKEKELPLIARTNLDELKKQREKNLRDRETSILGAGNYAKKIPTLRLCYVAIEKFPRYGTNEISIGQTYGISSPFELPKNMSLEDACKVVSYLSDKVKKENNLEPTCEKSVIMVSKILEDYGFKKVENANKGHYHVISQYTPFQRIKTNSPMCDKIEGVVDLFTVDCDFKMFKKTDMYKRYFNWYSEGISKQDIADIYKSIRKEYLLSDITNSKDEKCM